MRLHLFYFVLCFILLSCQSDKYHWKNQDDRMVLMSGKTVVGELNPSVTKGMNRTDQIEMLDSCTFKITCQYTTWQRQTVFLPSRLLREWVCCGRNKFAISRFAVHLWALFPVPSCFRCKRRKVSSSNRRRICVRNPG